MELIIQRPFSLLLTRLHIISWVAEHVLPNVAVVAYDWRVYTLQELLRAVKKVLSGGKVLSIAVVAPSSEPGCVGMSSARKGPCLSSACKVCLRCCKKPLKSASDAVWCLQGPPQVLCLSNALQGLPLMLFGTYRVCLRCCPVPSRATGGLQHKFFRTTMCKAVGRLQHLRAHSCMFTCRALGRLQHHFAHAYTFMRRALGRMQHQRKEVGAAEQYRRWVVRAQIGCSSQIYACLQPIQLIATASLEASASAGPSVPYK
eukprot:1159810-Pelagomonas_calceolata.AAC.7